ncbi:MAG TPA: DegQ family serine endoprotease [Bryobacteraceae bacterium]|nr:DegQ family serine endoprotease [Bryobacteraceae bacterium]
MRGKIEIRRSVAVLAIVCASIGGGLVASYTRGGGEAPIFATPALAAAVESAAPVQSFAHVVKRTAPAVVNISTTKVIRASDQMQRRGRRGQQPQNPFFDDPFFRQFFGDMNPFNMVPRDRRESALGSGVIVSPDGYILTNNHVVEGATTVKVTLADRREFTAKVVGTDPQTDVAVLKIDASKLPVLPLSSAKPEVGDLCLAIGDPFGIGQTVTMGIVSATGRNLGGTIEQYEDFIQTDAAINPGNSGGALINTRGELIGINTAILSGSGANAGVGFAIPVSLARNIMEQLIRSGKVTRGYIGAYLQDVNPELAKAFHVPSNEGVVITKVDPNTPAERAGLKEGDVVTAVNGEPVIDTAGLRLRIASVAPGSTVKMHIIRNGSPMDLNVTVAERPADLDARGPRGQRMPGNDGGAQSGLEGVSVEDLSPEVAQQLGLPRSAQGVVVTDVDQASAAADAGLEQGDVIEQVNRQPVRNTSDFERLVRQSRGGSILLLVNRGGVRNFVAIQSK